MSYDSEMLIEVVGGMLPLIALGFTVRYDPTYESDLAGPLSPVRLVYSVFRCSEEIAILGFCPGRSDSWVAVSNGKRVESKTPVTAVSDLLAHVIVVGMRG